MHHTASFFFHRFVSCRFVSFCFVCRGFVISPFAMSSNHPLLRAIPPSSVPLSFTPLGANKNKDETKDEKAKDEVKDGTHDKVGQKDDPVAPPRMLWWWYETANAGRIVASDAESTLTYVRDALRAIGVFCEYEHLGAVLPNDVSTEAFVAETNAHLLQKAHAGSVLDAVYAHIRASRELAAVVAAAAAATSNTKTTFVRFSNPWPSSFSKMTDDHDGNGNSEASSRRRLWSGPTDPAATKGSADNNQGPADEVVAYNEDVALFTPVIDHATLLKNPLDMMRFCHELDVSLSSNEALIDVRVVRHRPSRQAVVFVDPPAALSAVAASIGLVDLAHFQTRDRAAVQWTQDWVRHSAASTEDEDSMLDVLAKALEVSDHTQHRRRAYETQERIAHQALRQAYQVNPDTDHRVPAADVHREIKDMVRVMSGADVRNPIDPATLARHVQSFGARQAVVLDKQQCRELCYTGLEPLLLEPVAALQTKATLPTLHQIERVRDLETKKLHPRHEVATIEYRYADRFPFVDGRNTAPVFYANPQPQPQPQPH